MIHAMVLDLPGGQVAAAADWRMHDRSRYLWPLGGGRFLVRQGNVYSTVDASLTLKQWLTSSSGILATEVSPDGQTLVSEDEYERHTPEEHQKLVDEAKAAGIAPPKRGHDDQSHRHRYAGRVLDREHVTSPVVVPIVRSGYLTPEKGKDDEDYLMQFVPFAGARGDAGQH